jgi:hypothetical protein
LAKLANKLTDCLNPDGNFTDVDRARQRGIIIGRQDIDGMSPIKGYLTPQARATLDAVFVKLAAPHQLATYRRFFWAAPMVFPGQGNAWLSENGPDVRFSRRCGGRT